MNRLNNREKQLQQRLRNHEMTPPADGWERLMKALDGEVSPAGAPPSDPPSRPAPAAAGKPADKPRQRWIPLLVTSLSAAACIATAVFLLRQPQLLPLPQPEATTAENAPAGTLPKAVLPQQEGGSPAAGRTAMTAQAHGGKTLAGKGAQTRRSCSSAPTTMVPPPAESPYQGLLAVYSVDYADDSDSPATAQSETAETAVAAAARTDAQAVPAAAGASPATARKRTIPRQPKTLTRASAFSVNTDAKARKTGSHKPVLALYSGLNTDRQGRQNGLLALSNSTASLKCPTGGETGCAGASEMGSATDYNMDIIVGANANQSVRTRIDHAMPLELGLSVQIPLTDGWKLVTGVTYTRLSTHIESGSESSFYLTRQRLHYVGIPVQASYQYFRSRPLNLYVTTGAKLEKCVKGSQHTRFVVADAYRSSVNNDEVVGRGLWQASVGVAAGLQLNLTQRISLYAEPGITYYLPDNSSLPNIRHDRPWQFTVPAGLRYSF